MTHLTREQIRMIEGFLQLRVSMLTLDCNAEQTGEAGQEVRIGVVELSGIGTVSLEDAERRIAVSAPSDQNIDRALDALLGQKLWRSEACFFLQVIGDDRLPGMECKARGGLDIRTKRYLVDRTGWQPMAARTINRFSSGANSRTICTSQTAGTQFSGPWENYPDIASL